MLFFWHTRGGTPAACVRDSKPQSILEIFADAVFHRTVTIVTKCSHRVAKQVCPRAMTHQCLPAAMPCRSAKWLAPYCTPSGATTNVQGTGSITFAPMVACKSTR